MDEQERRLQLYAELNREKAKRDALMVDLHLCRVCGMPESAHEGMCPPDAYAQERDQERRMGGL